MQPLNPMEMPAAPGAPALALPADANRSGAARLLLLLSLQPSSRELPRPSGSSPPAGSPWGCPRSPTLNGTTQSLAGASGVRRPSKASCHQAITLQRKKLFHPSRETSSQEPPAKCLYQGAGEEEGRGWKRLTLPGVGHSNLFRGLRPAEREKCLLQHELVQFIIVLAYLRSIAAGRPDPTGGTGHPAPGLRGFHLQSQQVWGCIPLLRPGSAPGCGGCLLSASCTGTSQKLGGGSLSSKSQDAAQGGLRPSGGVTPRRDTRLCQHRGHDCVGLSWSQQPHLP